ncbi:MAG: POTRA domain-containing protein [Planctomycetota bacterium]
MRRAVLLSFLCWFVPIAAAAPQDDRPVGPVLQGPPAPQGSADAPADERVQDAAPVVVGFGFEGPSRYDVDRMRETLGVVIGTRLDDAQRERIARGMESLWATGMVADVEYQVVPGGIELRLVVTELPLDLSPRFVGNERVDDDDVVEWAGLRRGDEVRFSQARTIALQLEERYHQEGYYFASVRAVPGELVPGVAGGPPEQDIIFEIDEGPKVRVRALRYSGNDSLPIRGWGPWASGLRHEASPKLRGPIMRWLFGSLFSVPFRKDRLDEDVVAMREAYRRLGYLDAVVQVGELEFSDDRSWVTIHLVVDEGEPYIVTSVRVAGFQRMADQRRPGEYVDVPTELLVPEDELLALCKLERGDRLLRYEVESDGIAFARRYGSMGHIAPLVDPDRRALRVLGELVFAPRRVTPST